MQVVETPEGLRITGHLYGVPLVPQPDNRGDTIGAFTEFELRMKRNERGELVVDEP